MDDTGVPLCKAFYTAEVHSPLIITTNDFFQIWRSILTMDMKKYRESVMLTKNLNLFWITDTFPKVQSMIKPFNLLQLKKGLT